MDQIKQLTDKIERAIQVLYDFRQQSERFNITNADGNHLVTLSEILYCKTIRVKSKNGRIFIRFQFQLTDGRRLIVPGTSLSHFEKILAPFVFIKINPSCLINLLQIKTFKMKQGKIIMKVFKDLKNNLIEEEFTISKSNREQVNTLYEALLLSSKNS